MAMILRKAGTGLFNAFLGTFSLIRRYYNIVGLQKGYRFGLFGQKNKKNPASFFKDRIFSDFPVLILFFSFSLDSR